MIWVLFIGLLFAAPPISSYMSLIDVPILDVNATYNQPLCAISNQTVPYYSNLFYDGRYDRITFVTLTPEWCSLVNDVYLLRLNPSPSLALYFAVSGAPENFCVRFQNTSVICSSSNLSVGSYNISSIIIPDYDGSTIKIETNGSGYLYWNDFNGYQYLGNCTVKPSSLNTSFNQIPYGNETNLLFYILARFTESPFTYIVQTNPNVNLLGYCRDIVVVNTELNLSDPVDNLLVLSDYNRNFYKFDNGLTVLALNNSYTLTSHSLYKPEFYLPSEAMLDSINYTSPEIALGFLGVATAYVKAKGNYNIEELKAVMVAGTSRNCTSLGCGMPNATNSLTYFAQSLYLHPKTKTSLFFEVTDGDFLLYSPINHSITWEAPNTTSYINLHSSFFSQTGNMTLNVTSNLSDYVLVSLAYKSSNNLSAIVSNRTLYKGYWEQIVLSLKNNNPTLPFHIEGIAVELWNSSGKVVDLYDDVLDLWIKPNSRYILPLKFYIPNDVPDGYLKVQLFNDYILEGLPIWQYGSEPLALNNTSVPLSNLTSFSAYKLDIPFQGFMDLPSQVYVDLDVLTKESCYLTDEVGNPLTSGLIENTSRLILLCENRTLVKPVRLFFTYTFTFKNVTSPSSPPIEISLNTTELKRNEMNALRFSIINRQLTSLRFNALKLILNNSSERFEFGLGNDMEVYPGEHKYVVPMFLPDVPYTNFSVVIYREDISEVAGKGSVYESNYNDYLPVQRVQFGITQFKSLWKDNITKSFAVAVKRPSTLCYYRYDEFPGGTVNLTLNNNTIEYRGVFYSCGTYSVYYSADYSNFYSLDIKDGYNFLSYYISPDYRRIFSSYADKIRFLKGIKFKLGYEYSSNRLGSIVNGTTPSIGSLMEYNITTNAQLAEGYLNKLYINVTSHMEQPIELAYVDVRMGDKWLGGKRYNRFILPNETFSDYITLYGINQNVSNLTIDYVFAYETEPLVFKKPIPTYIGVCDGLFGPTPCVKEDLNYVKEARKYNFSMEDWFSGVSSSGENRYIYRIPIYIPSYLRALAIYTSGVEDMYYASPSTDPVLIIRPVENHYSVVSPHLLRSGPAILSTTTKTPAPKLRIKYYINFSKTLNVSNPGILDVLPTTLYYYRFQDQIYLKFVNNNPFPLRVYFLQTEGDVSHKIPRYVDYVTAPGKGNSTYYFKPINTTPNGYKELLSFNSPYRRTLITHLGRRVAHYANSYTNLTLSFYLLNYSGVVFQGGMSKDFNGTLYLNNITIPISLSHLTWRNGSDYLIFIPRYETPTTLIGDFILFTNESDAMINSTTGSFFVFDSNCSVVLSSDICSGTLPSISQQNVEAYYLEKDVSTPYSWRRGLGDITRVSREESDISYWPMERMAKGNYLYALRLYIPTNLYQIYLPAASEIYINGNPVNSSQLITLLTYGDNNNIVYSSNASNPYAVPILIYGLPTIYSSFNVRNLSIYPGGYRYVGTPRNISLMFNVTNNGNYRETILVVTNLTATPSNFTLEELESKTFNISIPTLPAGDYLFLVNVTTIDNNITFTIPIILNLSEDFYYFDASASPDFYNLTVPDNASGYLYITSNSSKTITIDIAPSSSGVFIVPNVTVAPNTTIAVPFNLSSIYIKDSKNITFTLTSNNITTNATIEVLINVPISNTSVIFNISVNQSIFNVERPNTTSGYLYITSNSSQTLTYSLYTDNPALFLPPYVVIAPNSTAIVLFNISSLFLNSPSNATIFVTAKNITKNITIFINISLPLGIISGNYTTIPNQLRLVLDKNIACINETVNAYVYDGYGNYVDGAEVVTSLGTYTAQEGHASLSFDREGKFYVKARMDGYKQSRTQYVLVQDCNIQGLVQGELILQGNGTIENPQSNVSIILEQYEVVPSLLNYTIEAPDQVIVNTSAFVRVLDNNGHPYVGRIIVISPSNQTYYYTTDSRGYALVYYPESGNYTYYLLKDGKLYKGPKTKAHFTLQQSFVAVRTLPLWPLWLLALMLLAWFVAKVEILLRRDGKLIGRVTNVLGMPIKDATVTIKAGDKTITAKTDNNGLFKASVGVAKAHISVKWKLTIGTTVSEHEKMD